VKVFETVYTGYAAGTTSIAIGTCAAAPGNTDSEPLYIKIAQYYANAGTASKVSWGLVFAVVLLQLFGA
jgi:hypothetical protein